MDTGRVISQDIRVKSAPVPSSELTRFHMCGPPDCDFDEIRECSQRIGEFNYAGLHQRLTRTCVMVPTSAVQVQTENDVTIAASQTDEIPITFEIKKRVLIELGMSHAELAEACIESPEELCRRLQDFTDHQPSSSYQRVVEVQMESDSDDDSAASTATTERRAWELQGDEPQNEGNEDEPENDDDRNDENDERDAVPAEEPTGTNGIQENVPEGSQGPVDAATRTIVSVKPRFASDKITDRYWQEVWQEFLKGNLVVTQQQCEFYKEAHPIAKALAEGNCDLLDPHIQALIASGQGISSRIDSSEVTIPRVQEEIEVDKYPANTASN